MVCGDRVVSGVGLCNIKAHISPNTAIFYLFPIVDNKVEKTHLIHRFGNGAKKF